MTTAKEFATQSGALCVGASAFLLGDPSGGTLLATPLTALAAIGLTLKSSCATKAEAKAQKQILKALSKNPEFTAEHLSRAQSILADAPSLAALDPKAIASEVNGNDFETEVSRAMLANLAIGSDDTTVHSIIETALIAGITAVKSDPDFRAALTLELVLEAGSINSL